MISIFLWKLPVTCRLTYLSLRCWFLGLRRKWKSFPFKTFSKSRLQNKSFNVRFNWLAETRTTNAPIYIRPTKTLTVRLHVVAIVRGAPEMQHIQWSQARNNLRLTRPYEWYHEPVQRFFRDSAKSVSFFDRKHPYVLRSVSSLDYAKPVKSLSFFANAQLAVLLRSFSTAQFASRPMRPTALASRLRSRRLNFSRHLNDSSVWRCGIHKDWLATARSRENFRQNNFWQRTSRKLKQTAAVEIVCMPVLSSSDNSQGYRHSSMVHTFRCVSFSSLSDYSHWPMLHFY
jgi:hypothetical protein